MTVYSKVMSKNSAYTVYLDMSIKSQSLANNTSVIAWSAYVTKSSGTGYYNGTANNAVTISIGGVTKINTNITYDFRNGIPKTVSLGSGDHTITHAANGTASCAGSVYFNDGSGNLGNATATGTLPVTAHNRVATVSSIDSPFTINNGFGITPSHRSNGVTYTVEFWNDSNATSLGIGSKGTTASSAYRSITFTEAEQSILYNYITSANGRNMYVRFVSHVGTTYIGHSNALTLVKPAAVSYTIPESMWLGDNLTLTITRQSSALKYRGGFAYNGSWITGQPNDMSSANAASYTFNGKYESFYHFVMGINTSQTSFTLQVYLRQYNANDNEVGLLIKNITVNVRPITISSTNLWPKFTRAHITPIVTGNVTAIDEMTYSFDGGATWTTVQYGNVITPTLTPNTSYSIRFKYKQAGTNYRYTSGDYTFKTYPRPTMSLSTTSLTVGQTITLSMAMAAHTNQETVTHNLRFVRVTDSTVVQSWNNVSLGTSSRTLSGTDVGDVLNTSPTVHFEYVLDSIINSTVEATTKVAFYVGPDGGAIFVMVNNVWTKYEPQVMQSGSFVKTTPHVLVNGTWVKTQV